jgi:sulfur carrier protein
MLIWINQQSHELPLGATLQDAVQMANIVAPFAAALNQEFVAKTVYAQTLLKDQDKIELIVPITGG